MESIIPKPEIMAAIDHERVAQCEIEIVSLISTQILRVAQLHDTKKGVLNNESDQGEVK